MAPNVNKPTDIKQKEADVNRKLQIYGIISAFKAGKVPSVRPSPCDRHITRPKSPNTCHRMTRSMSP